MIYKAIDIWSSPPLAHYGIPGMKWGVRNDTDRAANRLARYGRKLDKLRARYEMASQRTFKLSKKTDKLNRKANRLAKRSDKIASGKSDFGIWTDRQKKASSLAVKAYSTSEKKNSFEKRLYKSAAKANKYSKRVARYEKKVNKLMKQLNGVNATSLNISNKNKIYINDLLHNNMRHSDILDSDYLAHYGVKGMKWGVRKSVERTGRVVRKMGGAVKNSASRIAGGLVRTGSAVRRFKNRRAIKSGNSERISKRMNKMNTQELSEAVTRMQLANQIAANNAHRNTNTLGDVVSNSLKQKVGQMSQNALQTSVDSILRGESPLTGMVRNAKAQRALQEQQISSNRLQTISNNYKIGNSALQNAMNVSAMNSQIAKNNYNAANDRQNLSNLISPGSSTSTVQNGAKIAESLFARSKQPLYSQATRMNSFGRSSAKIVLYDNGVKPIVDLNAATRRSNTGAYTPRFARHDDINEYVSDFLAHYGVLGMKWGVRKDDTGDIYVDADDVYRRRESSYKQPTNDIEDRGYTYVYDPNNARDEEFYTQFGNRVVDKTFDEGGKIAGYESAGKAFCDHIFDTNDFDEVKYTDTMFKSAQRENGERHVMSLLSAPYDPGKSPEENRSNYENRLAKYGARTLGSGMGAERHPWLDDEEHREEGGRDPDTARNDAARRIADVLKNEGYIGMRDFKDIAGTAGVESPTILFNKNRNMYDEAYRKEIDKRLLGL